MATNPLQQFNLNGTTPAAPGGYQLCGFQQDGGSPIENISMYTPSTGGVNLQTAAYAVQTTDCGKLIVINSATAVSVTLPAAIPFSEWNCRIANIGTGVVTVAQGSLELDGSATTTLTLQQWQSCYIATDGNNWFAGRGLGAGSSGGSNATEIQSVGVSEVAPTDGQVLEYDAISGIYVPTTPSGGTGGSSGWTATIPASPTSAGTAGQYSSDGSHAYICYATNKWGKLPMTPLFENPPVTDGLLWLYDADMYSFTDGASVNAVTDLSGNGFNAVAQSSGAVFKLNQINGRAALQFSGTSAGRYNFANAFFEQDITIFCVASVAAAAFLDVIGGVAESLLFSYGVNGSGVSPRLDSVNTLPIGQSTAIIPVNTFAQSNATYSSATGAWTFRVAQAAAGAGTFSGAAPTVASTTFGWTNISGGERDFNGKIPIVFAYNRILTATEITDTEAWLNVRYAV